MVIHDDTHLRMLQIYGTVDIRRVVDITQQEAIALHRHSTGVRKHFVVVKQRILVVDIYREIVGEVQRALLSILQSGNGNVAVHIYCCL